MSVASKPVAKARAVALVLAHSWARVSTAPLMTAQYLASQGYQVDLYVDQDETLAAMGLNIPEAHPGITVRLAPRSEDAPPARLADGTELPREHWRFLQEWDTAPRPYDWLVGFDPGGLVRAAALAERWGKPLVYHSLEIDAGDHPGKPLERKLSARAVYSLSQDALRADLLARLNHLDRSRVFVSTNSSIGGVLPERKRYFAERFPVGNRRVVLAAGTLLPICGIQGIIESVPDWPQDCVLVLHGWLPDPEFRRYVEAAVRGSERMFLSTDIVAPEEKFELFQSADVGLVFFEPRDVNLANAGGSAGKLYDFMRCGVPCIGNDIPGLRELLEDCGTGVAIAHYAQLPQALSEVARRRDSLSRRCLELFPEYEFSREYASILRMTETLLA